MHQTRQEVITKIPIQRKGTKYVARAISNIKNSVPVVVAVRDMLKLARTSTEVKKMINKKLLKINWRQVKDLRESIQLFNLFEADKPYILTLLPTGRFTLQATKDKNRRVCKVINKTLIKNNKIQLNLHDGTNIISKEKIGVGDSLYLDLSGKIKEHIPLENKKEVLIIKGKYLGLNGKISAIEKNQISIQINDKKTTIDKSQVIVL